MNKAWSQLQQLAVVMALCPLLYGQEADVIKPADKPSGSFSKEVPDPSAWQITVRSAWEEKAKKAGAARPAKSNQGEGDGLAGRALQRVDFVFADGVRGEVLHFSDGTKQERFLTRGFILYAAPTTGNPMVESAAESGFGPYWGIDQWDELGWIKKKFFVGTTEIEGRKCDVYRQYFPESGIGDSSGQMDIDGEVVSPKGVPLSQLKEPDKATIMSTAFIDAATSLPAKLVTPHETWIYQSVPFSNGPEIPSALQERLQELEEAISRRIKRYQIPQ